MLIALFSLSLLLVNIGGVVLSRHEVLAAQPAREMLADGHWIVPTIAGEYRVNKPPTMGWLIAASMAVFHSKAEWVARLPAVLSGTLTCVLIAGMTAGQLGRRIGFLAGLLAATSFFILLQSRLSEADMPMAMCVTLAWCVIANRNSKVGTWKSSVVFYSAVGASFLLKGVGPVFVLPAAAFYAWRARDVHARRVLLNGIGIALFLLLVVAWPLAAWMTYHAIAQGWYREVFQRATGELGEQIGKSDPWYLYLYSIPMMFLPWFPLAVIGAIAGFRAKWHQRPFGFMLLCWFGFGFIVLNAIAWKHNHYSIPILPACMPAAAVGLMVWLRHNYSQKNPRHLITAVGWTILCGIGIGILLNLKLADSHVLASIVGLLAVCGLMLIYLEHKRRLNLQLAGLFITAWLVAASVFVFVIEYHDGYRTSAELGKRTTAAVPAASKVTLLGLGEHHITYYIDRKIQRIDELEQSADALRKLARPAYLLAPASARDVFLPLGEVEELDKDQSINRRQTEADRTTLFLLR